MVTVSSWDRSVPLECSMCSTVPLFRCSVWCVPRIYCSFGIFDVFHCSTVLLESSTCSTVLLFFWNLRCVPLFFWNVRCVPLFYCSFWMLLQALKKAPRLPNVCIKGNIWSELGRHILGLGYIHTLRWTISVEPSQVYHLCWTISDEPSLLNQFRRTISIGPVQKNHLKDNWRILSRPDLSILCFLYYFGQGVTWVMCM